MKEARYKYKEVTVAKTEMLKKLYIDINLCNYNN